MLASALKYVKTHTEKTRIQVAFFNNLDILLAQN